MDPYLAQGYLRISERGWNVNVTNAALRFLIRSHFPLYHLHNPNLDATYKYLWIEKIFIFKLSCLSIIRDLLLVFKDLHFTTRNEIRIILIVVMVTKLNLFVTTHKFC